MHLHFHRSDLVGHEICQKHDVTTVDTHSMVHHSVLNLIDDGGSSGLNTQSPLNLGKDKHVRLIKQTDHRKLQTLNLVITVEMECA